MAWPALTGAAVSATLAGLPAGAAVSIARSVLVDGAAEHHSLWSFAHVASPMVAVARVERND